MILLYTINFKLKYEEGVKMKRYTENQLDELAEILKHDGVISVPTDTVFGVCARADSLQAQENLRNVKNRPKVKAFPLMCSGLKQVKEYCIVDERSEKIMNAFLPGPLTVILPIRNNLPSFITQGMSTLAIRYATSETLRKLIELVDSPLYMTSANQSGEPVCQNLNEIEKSCPLLSGMLDGTISYNQASTILDCTKDELVILRQGPITMEQINEVLK